MIFCSMKKCIISAITILLLSACGQSDKQLITEAEALVEENPDSALVLLNNVEDRKHLSGELLARYPSAEGSGTCRSRYSARHRSASYGFAYPRYALQRRI